jgi:hypothetical protein
VHAGRRPRDAGASHVAGRFEPAVGTVFLALEAAGVPVDEPLLARLIPTLPPDTLFATVRR